MSKTNSPHGVELMRAKWEITMWLTVSKETKRRNLFNPGDYDEKGMLKQSACPELHHEVHNKFHEVERLVGQRNITPVIYLHNGRVQIHWSLYHEADRKQRIYDGC